MAPYEKRVGRIVYEAGPTGYAQVRALRERGFEADVIAPSRTPKDTGQEAKSDRLDSRKLAMWSAKGLLRSVRVPTGDRGHGPAAGHHSLAHQRDGRTLPPAAHRRGAAAITGREEKMPARATGQENQERKRKGGEA